MLDFESTALNKTYSFGIDEVFGANNLILTGTGPNVANTAFWIQINGYDFKYGTSGKLTLPDVVLGAGDENVAVTKDYVDTAVIGGKYSQGWVEDDGTILGGSGDFTVAKTGLGSYTMTFTDAAPTIYVQGFTASAVGLAGFANGAVCNVNSLSTTQCTVQIVVPSTGFADQRFSFIRFYS